MSTETTVCPICKGTGSIPKTTLSSRNISFLRDLFEAGEMEPFLNWAELKWRAEPDGAVTQVVHRELEIAMRAFDESLQERIESRDEEHQKWLQNFMEKLDLKEATKTQLIEKLKEQWKDHVLECQGSHHATDNKLTAILERLELVSKVPAKGFKFEDRAIEQLEADWPTWEFEPTQDSKLGDCIAKPKVKNGNGEYEPTKHQILLEFTTEKRVGTQKIRQLVRSMKRRNITFGTIITEKAEQITKKYYPCRFEEGKIAIVPFELRNVALSTFETVITILHQNGKDPEEVDWEKVATVIDEIVQEEENLVKDIVNIGNNLISYSKGLKTKLTNRLENHTRKATDRLVEILRKQLMNAQKK